MKIKNLTYNNKDLKLYLNDKSELFFDDDNIKKIFDLSTDKLSHIVKINKSRLHEDKEYIFDAGNNRLWSKLGIIKLGFFTQHDDNLGFIDFLETLNFSHPKKQEQNISNENLVNIYKTLEGKFVDFSKKIEKEENVDSDELQKFIETFNAFVKTRSELLPKEKAPIPTALLNKNGTHKKNGVLKNLFNLASKTGSDSMDFASQTRDQAYDFASKTEDDAFTFTQDTRDKAYDFTSKTEDDAFQFATKMEDDAYKFVSKMADDAYHFASDGMNYGYMFASQGEELGPMADRVLWMASEIGLMADRIGEMSDRIVHTEHLIMNMSVMILNFGLLIDGTIKTIAEAGLNAIGIIYDKEKMPELKSSTKHIDLIGRNVELILTQQHEYDLKVLDNQKELRTTTISALDKISLEY
ncbi:MAG: hypothetical protein QM497_01170 [Sulfurimonas sp.]